MPGAARHFLLLSFAHLALCAACDRSPTAPGRALPSLVPPPEAPPPLAPIRLQGRVVEDTGRGVAEARISFGGSTGVPLVPIVADEGGRFVAEVGGSRSGAQVTVERQGFEPSLLKLFWPEARPGDTVDRELRLYAVQRIWAGESIQLTIRPGDPFCVPNIDEEATCRRVRVVAREAGLLMVRVDPPFWVFLNGGGIGELPVDAGTETIVEVLLYETPPRTAVVQTSFQPR